MHIITTGPQPESVAPFVRLLASRFVEVLVDTRPVALSRDSSLSRSDLRPSCEAAGIQFMAIPDLGHPADFEPLTDPERAEYRLCRLRRWQIALDPVVAQLDRRFCVGLLFVEHPHAAPHRAMIAAELAQRCPGLVVTHL